MILIEDDDRDHRSAVTGRLLAARHRLVLPDTETTHARPDATSDTHTDATRPTATLAHCQPTLRNRLPRETAPGQYPSATAHQCVLATTPHATECQIERSQDLPACAHRRVALRLSAAKTAGTLGRTFRQHHVTKPFLALPIDQRLPARHTHHLDRDIWDPPEEVFRPAVLVVAGAPADLLVQAQDHRLALLLLLEAPASRLGLAALLVARAPGPRRKAVLSTPLPDHLPSTQARHASLSHRAL